VLQITRQTEYAIRGLVELVERKDDVPVRLKDLAEACQVSEAFLAKIFQSLTQKNIIKSHRGVKGGFSLSKDPAKVTLFEIVDICEGGVALNHCMRKVDPCNRSGNCAMSKVWNKAQKSLEAALSETTLADLV
jgi:Rrf2 family protein